MRLGFFLGFLLGAGIASALAMREREASEPGEASGLSRHHLMETIREHAEEAKAAGREAAREKREEMLRDYEETVHRPHPEG